MLIFDIFEPWLLYYLQACLVFNLKPGIQPQCWYESQVWY